MTEPRARGRLVFDPVQSGQQADLSTMSEPDAVAWLLAATTSMPKHRLELNFGEGPAPEIRPGDSIRIRAFLKEMLRESESGGSVPDMFADARAVGAFWYWGYATARTAAEINAEYPAEIAFELGHGNDRTEFWRRRREIIEWMIAELFGDQS